MTNRPRRAIGVVLGTLLAIATAPILMQAGSRASAAPSAILAQACQYPSDCSTTTSVTPSTTPGNTTTSTTVPGCGHGKSDEHNPHCTTTTTASGGTAGGTQNGPQLLLQLNLNGGVPGAVVTAIVCNAPNGQLVDITFNGSTVASATAGPGTCPIQSALGGQPRLVLAAIGLAAGHLHAQSAGAVAQTSFTVPSVGPGTYLVCAEAPGLRSACNTFTVKSGTAVLGDSFSNGAPLVSASNGNSFLAFTGMGLVRLLLLAGVLIAVGVFLVRRAQQRHA